MRSLGRDADGHRVDQRIAVVGGMEIDLAADRRHADAVAVAADAAHHAIDDALRHRVGGRAEAQRVQVGDRAGAHGEHVAQNAADAGGRALVGFDEARMVVALHLEHGGEPVADIDHAGVLAGAVDHPGRLGRQLPQPDARRLVAAVLRPHDAEHAEFGERRRAAHDLQDARVLVGGEAEFRGERLGRRWGLDWLNRSSGEADITARTADCHRAGKPANLSCMDDVYLTDILEPLSGAPAPADGGATIIAWATPGSWARTIASSCWKGN